MKLTKNFFVIIIILISFFSSIGFCNSEKISLFYGNGVSKFTQQQSEDTGRVLLSLISTSSISNLNIEYEVAYNPSEGILDLLEVFEQKFDSGISKFWRILSGLDPMPAEMQEKLEEIADRFDQSMAQNYPSVQEHIETYNKKLCEGDKVIVVAHSQGNLFANIAYTGINPDLIDSFGIVSVANPDSYVAGGGPHTLIEEDYIIGSLLLPWIDKIDNFFGPINLSEPTGHYFIESYMASGRLAETKILNDIVTTIGSLEWPDGSCSQYLLATCVVESGDEFCMVWDLNNNQMVEDVPLDIGGVASFPCKKENISFWLAGKYLSGTPVIEVSDPVEGSPIYYGPALPPLTYTNYYNDANCQREGDCTEESASGSDTIAVNGIDENGSTGLLAVRTNEYIRKNTNSMGTQYIKSYQTYETPISARITYQFPLSQIKISSLTNSGGTRARAVSGNYIKSEEKWWTVEALWPATEETKWYYIDRTTETSLEYKSPFSDKTAKITSLSSTEEAKVYPDRTCIARKDTQSIADEKFTAKGIRDSKYMVLYYTNEVKGINSTQPCCSDQGGGLIACPSWTPISYNNCMLDSNYSYYQAIDFEVKAFAQKVAAGEDINEMNPFEVTENSNLGAAMLDLKNYAASLSNYSGDRFCSEVSFGMHFIE